MQHFRQLLLGLVLSCVTTGAVLANPTGQDNRKGKPHVVADVRANSDLRIDPDQLWMDWAPDGKGLVYVDGSRRLMFLDLTKPRYPWPLSEQTGYAPRFRPDGTAIAFTGGRVLDGRTVDTLYLQPIKGGAPIDLLPGERAVQSVSTAKVIHQWLGPTLLSYEEHMGTGVQQLFLLKATERIPTTNAELLATRFKWSPDGRRVAGHWTCCPSRFWVWDRIERRFYVQAGSNPGPNRWFEAWSEDGHQVLYTEWRGNPYHPRSQSTLYRLDIRTGRKKKLFDDGVLADWSGNSLAFVKIGSEMTLVVADARDGRIIWTDNLGKLPDRFDVFHWDYRPVFAGEYLFYRAGDGEWRVSTARSKQTEAVFPSADDEHVSWSPDGHHGATLDRTGRLRVIRNPLVGS